jgi:metallo-beta-lactamase family protein
MILIETETKNILLECGMIQSTNSIDDYKSNSASFQFKPNSISYLFLNHLHQDHVGRTPKIVRDGFCGKIISTEITAKLLKPMLLDSAKIIRKDSEYISRKRGRDIEPYYDEDDVKNTLQMVYEYDYDTVYELDEEISFKFLKNSHIVGAAQLELFIKSKSGHIHKILYTSDLGRVNTKNHYVEDLDMCKKANVVISECTYGAVLKDSSSNRAKDLEKIKTIVNQVCMIDKGRILIPVFSLARSHQILTDLFLLYYQDESFKIPVICDSPLIWELTKAMNEVLKGESKELFERVLNWKNLRFIKDYNESKSTIEDKSPKIVLSSSGFLHKGRSLLYLKEYVSKSKDHIISVGYAPPNSIAGKIKHGQKSIFLEGKSYKIKCGITTLNSFSSHITHKELLNYLKDIQAEKICLVHGDMGGKLEFKEVLEEELAKKCKTTRVIATNKGSVCRL